MIGNYILLIHMFLFSIIIFEEYNKIIKEINIIIYNQNLNIGDAPNFNVKALNQIQE